MSQIKNKQHPKRKNAIDKLEKMMNYPGRFPILVVGDTGTGKTHWVKHLCNEAIEFSGKLIIEYGGLAEETYEYWDGLVKKADKHFLLIKEVEKLSIKSQELLFKALSTENGLYGFEEKNLTIRLIFTTCFPIEKIRDDRRYLTSKFFDRISQFVVEFPNFDQTQVNISEDFIATWEKMFGQEINPYKDKCPKGHHFIKWLEGEAYRMSGNFRDLDKIVINWNLHQIVSNGNENGYSKEEILKIVKEDFKRFLHNPNQKIYEDNTFVFEESLNYGEIMDSFRINLKKWVLAYNNNDKIKAANMLGISYRTMERWT
ncbi:MAG: sigma 54-interacting transcriptional regulator [Bacteroidales bacterium]|nr:sigma 54-interacting transcriptional regulator [Bacteroidales bacterium]